MKSIGMKLADGTFYPIIEEGGQADKTLVLTTVKDNQTQIHVDLYRSDLASMTDAEYVNSLKIEELVARPNGISDIRLKIRLDENGKLAAALQDAKTGAETRVPLVSRTPEERGQPADYTLEGLAPKQSKPSGLRAKAQAFASAASAPAGGGLLAAAMKSKMNAMPTAVMDSDVAAPDDFSLPDITAPVDTDTTLTAPNADASGADQTLAGSLSDSDSTGESAFDVAASLDDIPLPESADAATDADLAAGLSDNDAAASDDFSLPDMAAPVDTDTTLTTSAEDAGADQMLAGSLSASDGTGESAFDVAVAPDDIPLPEPADAVTDADLAAGLSDNDAAASDDFSLPDITAPADTDTTLSAPIADDAEPFGLPDEADDFSLPDFSDEKAAADTASSSFDGFELPSFDDLPPARTLTPPGGWDLPDFDLPPLDDSSAASDDLSFPDLDFTQSATNSALSDDLADLSLPEFGDDFSIGSDDQFGDIDFSDSLEDDSDSPLDFAGGWDEAGSMDGNPAAELNFDGLYDKETVAGDSSGFADEEIRKKITLPVIICILCALICLLATVLVLFVLPTKYNVLTKTENKEAVTAEEQPREPAPAMPNAVKPIEAQDDRIVVADTPEQVVPALPEKAEPKGADITYRIKWGDTLWDIADAYYKDPWRYRMIARYNNIRDPDYIISGTTIKLPAQ